jgi:hypothetical protein
MEALPNSQALDDTVSRWGEFVSAETENLFRRYYRNQETRQINLALGVAIAGIVPFIPWDYRVFGLSPQFWSLQAARGAWLLFCIALLGLFRRDLPVKVRDNVLTLWCLFGGTGVVVIGFTRPPAYFMGYFLGALGPMLLVYFVLPMPLLLQVGVCVIGVMANAFLLVSRHAELDAVLQRAVVVNYLLANFMGATVSWHLHRLRRQQFAALQREIGLRASLEHALSQVKTLEGYLPICAHCKSVRNDEGYWQQVEVYVREHTSAEVTHGICPKCVKEHFGEIAKAS